MTPFAVAAARYAAHGWRVHPCRSQGKQPLLPHAVHDASSDAATVAAWWTRWPTANVAVAVPSGGVVVDVDPKNGGPEAFAELRFAHAGGPLPPTMTAETRSGGTHMLFQRPAGVRLRGQLCDGVDLLGFGRYFLAAPSVVPADPGVGGSGRYRWLTPKGTPVAPLPPWLLALARAPEATAPQGGAARAPATILERARRYLAAMPPAISGSNGSGACLKAALAMVRGFELHEDDALALLVETYNPRCLPPWSVRELKHKVKSAAAGRVEAGWLLGR